MDDSRPEYPAAMATLQPDQALTVFNDRISTINQINSEIADWLQDRRQIEEQYVAGLRRLTRKQAQGGAYGILQVPWDRIVSGAENLASAHEFLSQRIQEDVERPLRSFGETSSEMMIVTTSRTQLTDLAKEFESAQRKADKADHGRKAEDASAKVKDVQKQWETTSSPIFGQLQALDEARINNIRAALTQLQTHEADVIERNRASAESCLNALLSLEAADEIKTFAVQITTEPPPAAARADALGRPSSQGPPAPPPPRLSEGRAGFRTDSMTGQDRDGSQMDEKAHKGKLSGLKRIGTVMRGRKNVAPPPTPAEKKKDKIFSSFRRGDSQTDVHGERGSNLTPITSRDSRATPSNMNPAAFEEPRQPPTVNGTTETQTQSSATPNAAVSAQRDQLDAIDEVSNQAPDFPTSTSTTNQPPVIPYAGVIQPTPAQPIQSARPSTPPIESEETSRNLKILDNPIQEDEGEAERAMTSVADQLRTQAQSSGVNRTQGSARGRRDVRNTMYVPNTPDSVGGGAVGGAMLGAAAGGAGVAAMDSVSPLKKSTPGMTSDEVTTSSDAGSIHSSHSLAGLAYHTDMHEPGLNASIVETISTWFDESGIVKVSVVGEVALAYNTSGATTSESETIRLQNFQILEKVAANPTFVTALKSANDPDTEDNAGAYTVSVTSIKRPSPTVGLKYQLHVDESNMTSFTPLILNPAWQIVDGQASIIVMYSLNPAFASASFFSALSPITLKNVAITVNLDTSGEGSGKASSAMMSPTQGASFRRKAGAVIWRFNELTLKPGDQGEKLLVRFMTQGGPVKRGNVEAKFELNGRTASTLGVEKSVTHEMGFGKDEDPFADANTADRPSTEAPRWELMDARKMLVTGRYTAA